MKRVSKVWAEEVQQVRPGLWVWQAYDPACKADLTSAAHLVDAGLVLLDPVELAPAARTELLEQGDPVAVVFTNGNHERAGSRMARRWRLPTFCHAEAVAELTNAAAVCVEDGQALFGGLTVITLSGGGPGELALYHAGTQTLSFGDLVINLPGYGFSLLPDKYCRDPQQARASLQKLRGLAVSQITFAHGLPLVTGAAERLTGLLAETC